jgi:glycerol transport system permease protein
MSAGNKLINRIGVYLIWIVLSLVTLIPIYWMFIVSARSRVELFARPSFLQTTFFIENFTKPLSNPTFQGYLFNSILVATLNALLVTFLALTATYALSRWRLSGSDNIFFWTITNRMAPPAAFMLPLFLLFTRVFKLGDWSLFDTRIGLILLYCVFNLPFAIWLMKGIIDGLPIELDEAAVVDGAGLWTVLFRIIAPLAAPGIAVTAILSWMFAWNEYLFAAP